MKVTTLNYSPEIGNIYIIGEEGEPAIVVDFGYNKNHCLENYLNKHHQGKYIIFLTHGHYDHISGLADLDLDSKLPIICVCQDEFEYLFDKTLNLSEEVFGKEIKISENLPFYKFEDEDEFYINSKTLGIENKSSTNSYKIQIIETPFHTKGSTCFYFPEEKVIFTGDTLFKLCIGRYDLKGSCPRFIRSSLDKLKKIPDDVAMYPGHGSSSTMGFEKVNNDFLNGNL